MANQPNSSDQEIDLAQVSQKLRYAISRSNDKLFDVILFFKRNIILVSILLIAGIALGIYLDSKKVYTTKMFVIPNFGSVDYLYSKVGHINSKLKENDEAFYKETGLGDNVVFIDIEPVVDIYKFIEGDKENKNYEIFKLMAESNEVSKVMEDTPTGKYYKTHLITVKTSGPTTRKESVEPLLKYLNNSPYYKVIQQEAIKNLQRKIATTDVTLNQIDGILNDYSRSDTGANSNMIYYNDNKPLHEIIKLKNELTDEQAENRIDLINAETVIHDSGTVLNDKDTKGIRGKMKFIIPLIFLFLFVVLSMMRSFYKSQMRKRQAVTT